MSTSFGEKWRKDEAVDHEMDLNVCVVNDVLLGVMTKDARSLDLHQVCDAQLTLSDSQTVWIT